MPNYDPDVRPGAVLYDDRVDDERGLCHVTAVWEDMDGDQLLYEVWDGTHTSREYVLGGDLLAEFTPAGWSLPTHEKPTYFLTRVIGVHDPNDLMLEANRR